LPVGHLAAGFDADGHIGDQPYEPATLSFSLRMGE
jgi:hypothetical protein